MPGVEARWSARTRRFDDVVNRLTVVVSAEGGAGRDAS